MNKFTDISVYYEPNEKDDDLGPLSNYVSELYHHKLNGYKPPKTSRISLTFQNSILITKPMFAGSVCCYYFPIDPDELNIIKDRQGKYKFLLDKIHAACLQLTDMLNWDKEKFENAYNEALRSNFRLIKESRRIKSRDQKRWGQCIVEKTEKSSVVKFLIGNREIEEVKIWEKKNWYMFDSANRMGDKVKWIDNDKFGIRDTKSGRYLFYSISQKQIETNLTLTYEEM